MTQARSGTRYVVDGLPQAQSHGSASGLASLTAMVFVIAQAWKQG